MDKAFWEVHIYEGKGINQDLKQVAGTHICSKDEWDNFYTAGGSYKEQFAQLKK